MQPKSSHLASKSMDPREPAHSRTHFARNRQSREDGSPREAPRRCPELNTEPVLVGDAIGPPLSTAQFRSETLADQTERPLLRASRAALRERRRAAHFDELHAISRQ